MHRTKLERLTEIILGDAVLALLDSGSRIGADTVRTQLNMMLKRERNAERTEAIRMALDELQAEFNPAHGDSVSSVNVHFHGLS